MYRYECQCPTPVPPGVPPFWAESEQGVAQQVLKGQLDFHRDPWPKIATPVKDLVRSMLHLDPTKRFTASQVLGTHPHPTSSWVGWAGLGCG